MKLQRTLIVLSLALIISGCSVVNQSSIRMPGTDIKKIQKFYVEKLDSDERNIHIIIRDQLIKMGFEATIEEANYAPGNFDAVVTYSDRWMWDMSNYMIRLTIYFKNPENGYVIAAGKSFRTSLSSKTPVGMVEEVLNEIFSGSNI